MLSYDRRLHDALAVDDAAESLGRGGEDQAVGGRAAVEVGDGVVGECGIDGDHDRDGCIELAEATHDPVLPAFFVVTFDSHGLEQLDGDLDLAIAMGTLVAVAGHLDLTIDAGPGEHEFGVATTDLLERSAGHHVEVPWLGVHRRRRTLGEVDDLGQKLARDGIGLVAPSAAAIGDQCFEIHRRHGSGRPADLPFEASAARADADDGMSRTTRSD